MNEATKQFFAKLYLQQITDGDYVDWAMDCLEQGFDSKGLRLLAGMSKTHSITADFNDLFRQSLSELNWIYLDKKESLFNYAKEVAKQILAGEIESVEAVEKIHKICIQLGSPAELEMWNLLYDGHSSDWDDRSRWIPFMSTYNHERWLQCVQLEAIDLAKANSLEEIK